MNPKAAIAAAFIISLIASAWGGWSARGWYEDAQHLAQAEVAAKRTEEAHTKVDALAVAQQQANAARAQSNNAIRHEVEHYAQDTPPADRVTLPGAWRVRHDAAASGTPAATAGVADDAAGEPAAAAPVDDAVAITAVADNYASCRDALAQVAGWQEWWQTVREYSSAGTGAP